MKINKLIIFIFLLLCFCKQNENNNPSLAKNKILSQEGFLNLKSKKYDTIKRQKLLSLAYDKLASQKDFLFFYKTSKEVLLNSTRINDSLGIISANLNFGYYFSQNNRIDSAYFYYCKAEGISRKIKKNPFLEHIYQYKADIFWYQKNFTESESNAIRALKIAKIKKNDLSRYISL